MTECEAGHYFMHSQKNATRTQRNKSITTKSSYELHSWLLATCIALTFLITLDVSNQVCLKTMRKVGHVLTVIQVRIYICDGFIPYTKHSTILSAMFRSD